MLAIWNLNDLEITFSLKYPELSIISFKSDIVTKESRFSGIPEWKEPYQCNSQTVKKEKEKKDKIWKQFNFYGKYALEMTSKVNPKVSTICFG